MILVEDIIDEAKKVVGTCGEPLFYRWLTDAQNLIANKLDSDLLLGWLDICTTGKGNCVTLPAEVQTVLSVNIGGQPSLGRDQLFEFHLNGPGSDCKTSCDFTWDDRGHSHPVYRDIETPQKLVCYVQRSEDSGKSLIVYGFDDSGNELRYQVNGEWRSGLPIPVVHGYAIPDSNAPKVSRITAVVKDITAGTLRLSTIDNSGLNGVLLGVYFPTERTPSYRRIQLSRECGWVRIAFRKTNLSIRNRFDHLNIRSRLGFLLALRAAKFYADVDLANAHAFEADAVRLELEAQSAATPPTYMPPQIIDRNNPQDKSDWDIR